MLFATVCAGCGAQGPSPCQLCIDSLVALDQIEVDDVDHCHVLFDYDDLSRRFVTQLKYRGVRASVTWFSLAMSQRVHRCSLAPFETITWVPAARLNRRRRGYDQGEVIARPLGRRLRVPVRSLLRRGAGCSQTGLSRAERLRGPSLRCSAPVPGRVLLVDDVVTTGASLSAAASALRQAGATQVVGMVVAHRRFR